MGNGLGLVNDRRRVTTSDGPVLRDRLNEAQRGALNILEYFGWELRFVRNQREPLPVIFDGDGTFVVIRADGSIDDHPPLLLRH